MIFSASTSPVSISRMAFDIANGFVPKLASLCPSRKWVWPPSSSNVSWAAHLKVRHARPYLRHHATRLMAGDQREGNVTSNAFDGLIVRGAKPARLDSHHDFAKTLRPWNGNGLQRKFAVIVQHCRKHSRHGLAPLLLVSLHFLASKVHPVILRFVEVCQTVIGLPLRGWHRDRQGERRKGMYPGVGRTIVSVGGKTDRIVRPTGELFSSTRLTRRRWPRPSVGEEKH